MIFKATKADIHNRGHLSDAFLTEMVEWMLTADKAAICGPRPAPKPKGPDAPAPKDPDIFARIKPILGPWDGGLLQRCAAMLESMRVLALFESGGDWEEGVDTSRLGEDTPENAEAGAWQVSYDSRWLGYELQTLLNSKGITNGVKFQVAMKTDHRLAMEYIARLMRITWRHNGPLYKDNERLVIRKSLRAAKHSIYPWLSRPAMDEFMSLIG